MKIVNITFIFPGDYFKANMPDEMFKEQANAVISTGFHHHYINTSVIPSIINLPFDLSEQLVIYRGWMLNKNDYEKLATLVKNAGGHMFISPSKYLLAHYLPNWYSYIEDLTPKTKFFEYNDNLQNNLLEDISWSKFFIKDYVKSLKTSVGSIIDNVNLIPLVIEEMKKYRGSIEGGICIREFEEYLPETETRFFAINGVPFGPHQTNIIPSIVYECCSKISHPFFSIDVIKTKNAEYRIVEIGDGQVSDYVGWELNRFVDVLQYLKMV
jgi:hypothetical protein